MGLFGKRKKPRSATLHVDGIGDVEIAVDPTGDVPQISIQMPRAYALGLDFQHKRGELGLTHPDTLHAAHRYAVALGNLPDRRSDAIDLLEWLVEARTGDQETRLLALNDLTRLLQDAGRLARAEETLRVALAGWERLRGQDDPTTLAVANNLAIVLIDLGRPEEAEGFLHDTVARRTRVLGPTHPDTVDSRANLAGTLRGTPARLAGAESIYRGLLSDIGPSQPELTQKIRHNLAAVLYHQGKLEQAESIFRQALVERERALGAEHPDVLATRQNLATVLNDRGQVAEAEAQLTDLLAASRRVLGRHHPATLETLVSLAAIRANQGRISDALPLLTDAIEGFRLTHGPDHPQVEYLSGVLVRLRHRG